MMRDVDVRFDAWVKGGSVRPLAVTGVRGCGKTHSVLRMMDRIDNGVYLDYDKDGLGAIMEGPADGRRILDALGKKVASPIGNDTIVVIDGIRTTVLLGKCLRSLNRLAGLCRLVVVGGVKGMFGPNYDEISMSPMSFTEFSVAIGGNDPEDMFSLYMVVGGMPAAVDEWRLTDDPEAVDRVLDRTVADILEDAAEDCGEGSLGLVDAVYRSIPDHLSRKNSKFMFSKVTPNARGKGLKRPIEILERMGAVTKVPIFEGTEPRVGSIPAFKLYTTDPGILRALYGMPAAIMLDHPRTDGFFQGLMEDTVLNGLIDAGYGGIRCWRSGNRAEAEFIIDHGEGDVPVQVDVRHTTLPRSLIEYSKAFNPDVMIQVCPGADHDGDGFIRIPPYAVSTLPERLAGWDC